MDPFASTEHRLSALRELLPATASGIRLDATIAGPIPAETDRAMRDLDAWRLRVGRSDPGRFDDLGQRSAEAGAVVAAVLGTDPAHIVLGTGLRGSLAGLGLARGVGESYGIALIGEASAELEHACAAVADVLRAPLHRPAFGDELPARTRLVVLPHIDAVTGGLMDVVAATSAARAVGAGVALDVSWSIGACPVDAQGLGVDAIVAQAHHWLLAPDGLSVAWAPDTTDRRAIDGLTDRPPVDRLLGLARSVGWLLMYVGLPWVFEQTAATTATLRQRLQPVPGIGLGTAQDASHVLAMRIDGWSADALAEELGRRCFAVVDADTHRDVVRVSGAPWLRVEEIERFVRELPEIAAHTPETLPRRPALTVLEA